MVTPDDISDPNIILNDLPYMGLLAAETSWIGFNDHELLPLLFCPQHSMEPNL